MFFSWTVNKIASHELIVSALIESLSAVHNGSKHTNRSQKRFISDEILSQITWKYIFWAFCPIDPKINVSCDFQRLESLIGITYLGSVHSGANERAGKGPINDPFLGNSGPNQPKFDLSDRFAPVCRKIDVSCVFQRLGSFICITYLGSVHSVVCKRAVKGPKSIDLWLLQGYKPVYKGNPIVKWDNHDSVVLKPWDA